MTDSNYSLSDIATATGCRNNNATGWGNGGWGEWILVFLIFAIFGRGFGGFGGFGGAGETAAGYTLANDFSVLSRQISDSTAMTERKLDGINNGICSLGYDQLAQMNVINQNVSNTGFNLANAIQQNGYETRLSTQALGSQLASCCCDIREGISGVNYNLATQANGLSREIERGFANTNYSMATQNCSTLQAIDKVGDRIIDYLANDKAQALRDENQALRLAASQSAQNSYLISQLKPPCPIPAYITCNPNAPVTYNTGCCGCQC